MKYIKIITLSLGFVILSTLAFVGFANAQNFKSGDTVTVAKTEIIDSMLFTGGSNIDIAGTVKGDVYCAGQNITISGTVNGDIFCTGQNILISGKIMGDVRIAAQSVTISGYIANSATIGTQTLTIDRNGIIGRDLVGGSQNIMINGSVNRDMVVGSRNITINGMVWRNIKGAVNEISVGSSGKIIGNLDYTGTNDPVISNGGHITGTVKRTAPKETEQINSTDLLAAAAGLFVYKLLAMMVLAITLILLLPKVFDEITSETIKSPGHTILIGAAATFLLPILIIVSSMTLVGIPLAMLAILLWVMTIILMSPFAGYLLGRVLFRNLKKPIWIMAVGVTLLMILSIIPIIGFITIIIAYLFGMGMVLIEGKKLLIRPRGKKS